MNKDTIEAKFRLYTAKLEATRRQLDVAKTSFFKAKTAASKMKWPNKPPTEKMRLLLRIVSYLFHSSWLSLTSNLVDLAASSFMGSMSAL